jgi:spore coat protein CotH
VRIGGLTFFRRKGKGHSAMFGQRARQRRIGKYLQSAAKLGCLLALLVSSVGQAHSQTSDDLFNDGILHEIRLTVNPGDWSQLKADFRKDTYYKANFSWRGIDVNDIGIRSRGTGSASGDKPYLGLDFTKYVSSQRFLGLTAFRLKNALQDASFVHDRLSMMLFRRMGLPAPREAYAKLFINGQYAGLYIIFEEMDANFLNRAYGESAGYFYQFSWVKEFNFEFLGDDPANYAPTMFEPKTRKTAYDPATIVAMVKAINQSSDANFVAAVSEFIDLKECGCNMWPWSNTFRNSTACSDTKA